MSETSTESNDSNGKVPEEDQDGSAPKRRNRGTREGASVTMHGLALVEFEVSAPRCTDSEQVLLSDFYDLDKVEGLPNPEVLIEQLLEDKVLEDCGELLGQVPMKQYVEEGLFLCFETSFDTNSGPVPYIELKVTPKGIEWLKQNYGPPAERHLQGFVPAKVRGRNK